MRVEPRAFRHCALLLLAAVWLAGCAQTGDGWGAAPRDTEPTTSESRSLAAERAFGLWRSRLAEHVATAGQGDPAILAELPALRSPASLRPTQIVFSVTDIDALAPGRDGFDAVGLMVGRHSDASAVAYVFVVGVIERQAYRPAALIDVRVVALTLHEADTMWLTGPGNAQALRSYERQRDAHTVLRFPAAQDRFALAPCASTMCVEERVSGARWTLY